jgi:cytosine/adenosine deaminase-related metal-dependent hydrolase
MDPAIGEFVGDVLIEGDTIAEVAPKITAGDSVQVVDVDGAIVMPGFIDTHRHIWQSVARGMAADWTLVEYSSGIFMGLGPAFRPEDVHVSTLLGLAETLDAGITTTLDWAHIMNSPEHTDAAIQAHRESGSRTILAYSEPMSVWFDPKRDYDFPDLRRVRDTYYTSDDALMTLALAPRGPEVTSAANSVTAWRVADELDLPISVHVGIGNWSEGQAVAQLDEHGVLNDRTTYIHCSTTTDAELARIADTGGTVSIAPEVELHMGHGYPPTRRLIEAGLEPSLSIDVCTGIGGDMFGAMRSMLSTQRGIDNQRHLDSGTQPDRLDLTTRDVLAAATINGARACGLDSRIGSITPGKQADIIILKTDRPNMFPLNNPLGQVALAAGTVNIDSVFVAGVPVKLDGELVSVDLKKLKADAESSRDYLAAATNIDLGASAELGRQWVPSLRG